MIYVFGRISLLQSSLNTRHKRSRVCWEVLSHQPLLRSHFSHSSSLVKETAVLINGLQDRDEKICQSTLLNAALACFLGKLKFLVLDRLFLKNWICLVYVLDSGRFLGCGPTLPARSVARPAGQGLMVIWQKRMQKRCWERKEKRTWFSEKLLSFPHKCLV